MSSAPHLTTGQRALLEAELRLRQQVLDSEFESRHEGRGRVEHAEEVLAQDGDDAPQRDADRDIDLARSDRAMVELGQVSRALRRIHEPDYGLCQGCGEPIAFDRLKLEPWAERCVPCETAHEGPSPARHRL